MKKIFTIFTSIILVFLSLSCSKKEKETIIKTNSEVSGKPIKIEVAKGEEWSHKQKLGFIKFTITPQIAIWIEDIEGNYIDTLYVTQAFGKQNWLFVKHDPDMPMRTSSLPYWMNKRKNAGLDIPTKNNPLSDSVSSASPKESFTLNSKIKSGYNEVVILAEFNKSFDVNEAFHAGEEGFTETTVNGQPSIIYAVKVNFENSTKEYDMKIIGHGGENGNDGKLYEYTEDLTTALKMIDGIKVILDNIL